MKQKLLIALLFLFIGFIGNAQDIAVNMIAPVSATPNQTGISFTIVVSNNGPANANNVTLRLPNTANVTINSVSCTAGPGTGSWATCPGTVSASALASGMIIPFIPEGGAVKFTVTATAGASGSYTNTATATYSSDSNTSNNSSSVTTQIFVVPCATSTYSVNVAATLSASTLGVNGGTVNVVYALTNGAPVPGIGNSFTTTISYSDLNNRNSAIDNRWEFLNQFPNGLNQLLVLGLRTTEGTGRIYDSLPTNNSTQEPNISPEDNHNVFTRKIASSNLDPLGKFTITTGALPTGAPNVRMISQESFTSTSGNLSSPTVGANFTSGFWSQALTDPGTAFSRNYMMPQHTYVHRYSAFSDGFNFASNSNGGGIRIVTNLSNVVYGYDDTPTITSISPAIQNVLLNGTPSAITVSATKFNTNTNVTYQWYRNTNNANTGGTLISGATSASYTPPTSSTAQNVYYYVIAKGDGTCSTTSNPVSVSFASCTAPTITSQPTGTNYCQDATATPLSVTATGATSYQWYRNTTNSASGGTAVGTNSATYTPLTTAALVGTSYYYVIARNGTCSTPSNVAPVTVTGTPATPVASASTLSNVCPLTTANLTTLQPAAVNGQTYEWHTVATNPSTGNLVATPNAVSASGNYYLYAKTVTGGCFSNASNVVTVTIVTCCNAGTAQVPLNGTVITN